ncbi:MAG: acyltransferase, partial [Chitinophagaceae bacterium]
VVLFHLYEAVYPDYTRHPIHHGYLAVDFFFLLSGFVVGYAYDDRWGRMTVKDFFRIRLIRLQPLVLLGVALGLIGFLVDPYNATPQGAGKIALATLLAFALLPGPDIRGWGETHPLNGPCWSLLQEYIANIGYALVGRRMGVKALWVVLVTSAALLCVTGSRLPNIGTGWSYETFWIATVRMLFPFTAGLLLFRMGRLIRIPAAFPLCSLVLAAVFLLPAATRLNGLFDAALVILIFPLIVAAGAGGRISGQWAKACDFLGRLSYPLYILHYPFIYTYTAWVYIDKPAPEKILPVAAGLFVGFIILAWAALKWYDEPLRAWLRKRYGK